MNDEFSRIEMILSELMVSTTPIIYNNKKTMFYYLVDIYQEYRTKYKTKMSINSFLEAIHQMKTLIVLENKNIGFSLISEEKVYDKTLGQRILFDSNKKKETQDLSDESSEINVTSVVRTNKVFKPDSSKNESSPMKVAIPQRKMLKLNYDQTRETLINSFQQGIICPISSLNNAMTDVYGSGFDFKTADCKHKHERHGSLLKFIECCDDILEIKRFNVVYIKRKDFDSLSILEKRQRLHYSHIGSSDFNYHIELLLVNMFPVKVTIEYQDLLTVFEEVYKKSLKGFFPEEPKEYLSKLKSDNLRVLYNNQRVTVTLVPSWNQEYRQFGNEISFLKVQEQNLNAFSKLACISEKIPEKVFLNKIDAGYYKIIKNLFGEDELNEFAAWNIPRCLQIENNNFDKMDLFKRSENGGLDVKWGFINQNVRIADNVDFLKIEF